MNTSNCLAWLEGKSVVLWCPVPVYPTAPRMIVYMPFRRGGLARLRPYIGRGDHRGYTIEWPVVPLREVNNDHDKKYNERTSAKKEARSSDVSLVAGKSYYNGQSDTGLLSLSLWFFGFFNNQQMFWGSHAWEQYPGYVYFRDTIRGAKKLTTRVWHHAMKCALHMPRPEWVKMGGMWMPGG